MTRRFACVLASSIVTSGCPGPAPQPAPPTLQVRGRVVDATGAPVARAEVSFSPGGPVQSAVIGTTDASGRYQVSIPVQDPASGAPVKELHVIVAGHAIVVVPFTELPDAVVR
jgi:hypothetical protein